MTRPEHPSLPVSQEMLLSIESKIHRSIRNNHGVHFSLEELDILTALGLLEEITLAIVHQLRDQAIDRIYRRAGLRPPSEPSGSAEGGGGEPDEDLSKRTTAYTPATLAKRWGVSSATVLARIKRGELNGFSFGRSYRVRPEEVAKFEAGQGVE